MYKFIALVKFYVDYLGLVFLLNSIVGVEVSSLNLRH